MKTILLFKTEGEALRMRAFLETEQIPFVIRSFGDRAYSSVFQNLRGWGELEAPEEYANRILAFYNMEAELPPVLETDPIPEPKKKNNLYVAAAVVFFLIALFLGWQYWDMKKKYDLLLTAEKVDYQWSEEDAVMTGRWKNNHQLAYKGTDMDYDFIYEKSEHYDVSGVLYAIDYDLNDNGISDKTLYYIKDEVREEYNDINEDCLSDNVSIALPGQKHLIFEDKNFDRSFDEVRLVDKDHKLIKRYTPKELAALISEK